MEKLIENIKNVFNIQELRNKVLFTFGILALYRLGCYVLVPGVNKQEIASLFDQAGGILNMVNMFSGGALANAAVFALGIMPYITASIILQLLQKSVPFLERLSKEGEQGRNKINRYTRYLTVALALLHSYGISTILISMNDQRGNMLTIDNTLHFRLVAMLTLTTGAIVIMWLGEKITEKGIGNGISLIIFASIVVQMPGAIGGLYDAFVSGGINASVLAVVVLIISATVIFVVFFESGERRITIQYAKRVSATGQMAGGTSHLPFKVNAAGVIPVIFSSAIMQIPSMIRGSGSSIVGSGFFADLLDQMSHGRPLWSLLFFVTTMFFTFFYVEALFNPKDTAENLKKHGGFIPGIRPGKETEKYIDDVLTRLTFWGGLYLSLVCLVPDWMMNGLQLHTLPSWLGGDFFEQFIPSVFNRGTGVVLAQALGGTSLLIVVSVALDFVRQIENQLVMRKYDGFTSSSKRGKVRTRRYA